jgi:hypothetical protein
MTDNEATPGFDRRSLIKKGLVGAGVAAATPVISTFNSKAFAASITGIHSAQYNINPNNDVVQPEPPDTNNCPPNNPGYVGGITGAATITVTPLAGDAFQFQLTGSYASCEFIEVTAFRGNQCIKSADTPGAFTGVGTNTVVFDAASFSGGNGVFNLRFVILC